MDNQFRIPDSASHSARLGKIKTFFIHFFPHIFEILFVKFIFKYEKRIKIEQVKNKTNKQSDQ